MRVWIAGLALLGCSAAAFAAQQQLDPAAVTYKHPHQFTWRDPESSPTNQTVLHGDPTKPGLYIVMNRFRPGNFSRPHFHPNDRYITVVKGTWWVGTGTTFDPNSMVPMPVGSYVTHFGKQIHYDGAKDEEVVVLIVGEGPATRTEVPETQ